jgi:hypothetical protein
MPVGSQPRLTGYRCLHSETATCRHNRMVSIYGSLRVGPVIVSQPRNSVSPGLLAVFHPDMLGKRLVPWDDTYDDWVVEFRAAGTQVARRLDLMGINRDVVLSLLNSQLSEEIRSLDYDDFPRRLPLASNQELEENRNFLRSLNAARWLDWVARSSSVPDSREGFFPAPGSCSWLMKEVENWNELYVLRIVLLALPDAEVVFDISGLVTPQLAAKGQDEITYDSLRMPQSPPPGAPLIVLTEGSTDSEFLAAAVRLLYPYLSDLIRFLDYERRPEGGVSALMRMIKSFAAAGVVNRVVAIFDNDTAAADVLRSLDQTELPPNIRVLRYPELDLARHYPTLGPPTLSSPEGSVNISDVNGLAGSIELYLGRDVLDLGGDGLCPVQWTSFISGMQCYQGEITHKRKIHEAFRAKCTQAIQIPERAAEQDWDGMRLIVEAILSSWN